VGARKLATVLLIVLIAGGPAVVAVCEAVCLPAPPTETSTRDALRNVGEHHQHHRGAETPSDREQIRADHNHQPVTEIGTPGDANVAIGRALARACCEQLAPPSVSLSASRADGDLLPGSQAALLTAAPVVTVRDRQPAGPTGGSPPGEPLPVRTSVVLRI